MSGLSSEGRALLDIARRAGEPTRANQDRVRAALIARLGATVAGPSTAPPPVALSALAPIAAKIALGVALVAGGLSIALAPHDRPDVARAFIARPALAAARGAEALVDVEATDSRSVDLDSTDAPPAVAAPERKDAAVAVATRSARRVPPAIAVAPLPRSGPDIVGEIAVLREAQQALRAGDPARAAAALDAFEATHPEGALGEERTAARLIARCSGGATSDGRAEADRFLAAHSTSPLAARVRAACASR